MLPIKQLSLTSAPGEPMQITLLAVPTALPALAPKAVLPLPVLDKSAFSPMAVFELPVKLRVRALLPTAVFSLPVVLVKRAKMPVAVF